MQTGSEQLKAQQTVMQAKGMYNGKIDGIWGPKSIAAKLKWERSGKFSPAIPNNGFPLAERAPLPPGVMRKPDGTLYCLEAKVEAPVEAAPITEVKVESAAPVQTSGPAAGNNPMIKQNSNQNQQGQNQQGKNHGGKN